MISVVGERSQSGNNVNRALDCGGLQVCTRLRVVLTRALLD